VSAVVSVLLYFVISEQTLLQDELKSISARQTELVERQVDIQKQLAIPTAKYVRAPKFWLGEKTKNPYGPIGENFKFSYPNEAYFTSETGIASIRDVWVHHYGKLMLSDACRLSDGTMEFEVKFSNFLVNGGYPGFTRDTRSPFFWIVRPGLSGRLEKALSALEQLVPGCIQEARIDGVYWVKLVDIRSKNLSRYFAGYLKGDVYPIAEDEWNQKMALWQKGKCEVGFDARELEKCAAFIKSEMQSN